MKIKRADQLKMIVFGAHINNIPNISGCLSSNKTEENSTSNKKKTKHKQIEAYVFKA